MKAQLFALSAGPPLQWRPETPTFAALTFDRGEGDQSYLLVAADGSSKVRRRRAGARRAKPP